jgi:hypothetical protein
LVFDEWQDTVLEGLFFKNDGHHHPPRPWRKRRDQEPCHPEEESEAND